MVSCCFLHGLKSYAAGASSRQYAYIGSARGIFEFRVKPDGSLQPLRNGPVKGTSLLDKLLVDSQNQTVYALNVYDKLYSYAITKTGRLSLNAMMSFSATSVALDSQEHFLYALDGDNDVVVFDVLNPRRTVKKQTVVIPAGIHDLLLDPHGHSLWLLGERNNRKGRPFGGVLLRYGLHHRAGHSRGKHFINRLASYSIPVLPNALALAGGRLITANWGSTLTVFDAKGGAPLHVLSDQPLLKANVGHLPSRMVYRHTGSLLYISTYYGAQSARVSAPASAVIVCHLSSDGQIFRQTETGEPVPNPRPYLDGTGHFLYIVGEEGTVDAYRIAPDGHLLRSGSRITILAPTGMVFIGGTGK